MAKSSLVAGLVLVACLTLAQTEPTLRAQGPAGPTITDLKVVRSDGAATAPAGATQPATTPFNPFGVVPPSSISTKPVAMKTGTLSECQAAYMKGQYDNAVKGYEQLMSDQATRLAAAIGMSRALSIQGKYEQALTALGSVSQIGKGDAEYQLAQSDALSQVGRYEEALTAATKANEIRSIWAPGILAKGQLLEIFGKKKEAIDVYATMDKVVAGNSFQNDARSLVALGQIIDRHSQLTGKKASEQAQNVLQNYLQRAYMEVDKDYWPAKVSTGMFRISKHQLEAGAKLLDETSKKVPNVPDIYTGIGVYLLSEWKFEDCLKCLDKALKINPNHVDSLVVKATCLMQWRKFEQVAAPLEQALKVNSNSIDALCLMAALHVRNKELEKAQPYIDRVNKINPRCMALPNTIADWLAASREFTDAGKYYLQAIELAPEQADPLAGLGMVYMQTGNETKGSEMLDKAFALDDYRADVVNVHNLLEKMKKFEVKETEHFIVKADPADNVLIDQVAQYCEKMYSEVCSDFNYHPTEKTIVEFFPTHRMFSVRLTGKGWLGTVGASTGPVIALVAPISVKDRQSAVFGNFNWAAVLRHEFTHTVTLGATKNRIPHWFTEACAVWEQPDRRNFEATNLLVNATKAGKLFPIKDLDWGFIRPKANADRSQAYAQAEWVMEYIIATTKDKYKTINIMIEAFRDGKSQTEVFKDILGTTEEQFDKDFLLYAKKQIVEWGFDASPPPDLAAAQKEAKDKPEDPTAIGHLAIAQYSNRDARNGEANARKALDKAPDNIDALKVMAHFSFTTKKTDDAIEFAKRLERVDHNSRMAPRILADCYVEKRAWPEALAALELLKIREPQDTYSYERLANVYSQLGQIKNALPNYIELHKKTMNNPIYAREIADIYRTLGQQEDALHWYQSEMEINPYDSGAYQAMVSIHINAGNFPQATVAAMAMVDLDPDSATAWTYLATAQYRYGMASNNKAQLTQAKESAQKAVKIDPNGKGRDVLHMINAALGEPSDSPSADEPQTQPAQPQPKTKPHVEELAPDHAIE